MTTFASVAGEVETDSETFVDLGGPSLTVEVPASGTVQIAASVMIHGDDGFVSLYEDGLPAPGLGDCAGQLAGTLFSAPYLALDGSLSGPWGTPGSVGALGCATPGLPGPVMLQTTPGAHTYELRYASANCGCSPDPVRFANRQLWAWPMP